ncbi:MAG: extracellular solute-binding protein [Clostridiales bacterium]|nr:extracellular solute-binding protein [Clostridiales bacterium]
MKRNAVVFRIISLIVSFLALGGLYPAALAGEKMDYMAYCQALADAPRGAESVLLENESARCGAGAEILPDGAIHVADDGVVSFAFSLPEAAKYQISITCRSDLDERNGIDFSMQVNGQSPFSEAETLKMYRVWKSQGEITRNNQGDDITPEQVLTGEAYAWRLRDSDGLYNEAFEVGFEQGENTLSFSFRRGGMAIEQIKLTPAAALDDYAAYRARYADAPDGVLEGGALIFEAENAYRTSSPSLAPIYDKSSTATTPSSPSHLRLNTIGSNNWEDTGHWIEWEIDAPSDGLYNLAFRYRQNLSEGFFSSRLLTIDGQTPFDELSDVHFEYDDGWQVLRLGDEKGAYGVYLTQGRHVLRLEVTSGVMAQYIKESQDLVFELNELYRKVIMITGSSPDIFQDYNLKESVPGMIDTLNASAVSLRATADGIEALGASDNGQASYLRSVAYQMEDIARRPETMKERLDTFKSNLSALATWMLELKDQPLELDKIFLLSPEAETPSADAQFADRLIYGTQAFLSSFTRDYSNLGNVYEGDNMRSLRVWIVGGRDQAQVAKNLIDNRFVSKTGIAVNLELVQGGLTEAILSGDAPDIIMNLGRSDPVNLGVRGALVDLTQFSDYEEVIKRFTVEASVPYTYKGAAYALPVTQNFCMMFYRTDVFEELGLDVPETWDDFFRVARILQRANLQVGVPIASGTAMGGYDLFTAFLYQGGGSLLNEAQDAAVLDSPEAIEAFTQWTNLFVDMGLPLSYDFYSRFRTGEMPLAIQSYTQYNLLMTSAPDLTNLWAMAPLPGTRREDGTIDRSIMASGTASGISTSCQDQDAAWEFLKWWTDGETQYQYGTQLETLMGAAVRYDTANLEALALLPWSRAEYEALSAQMAQVKELPEIPASYFIYRSLSNAFRKVAYNTDVNPREAIVDYNLQINKEIKRKLAEFEQ